MQRVSIYSVWYIVPVLYSGNDGYVEWMYQDIIRSKVYDGSTCQQASQIPCDPAEGSYDPSKAADNMLSW